MSVLTLEHVKVEKLRPEEWPLLVQMYDTFDSEQGHGPPPTDPLRRNAWLESLKEGVNLVAWTSDKREKNAGHLILMPSEVCAEMAIFVHPGCRRQGVAWSLAEAGVEEARLRGYRSLWVPISAANVAARHGLRKFGFETLWEKQGQVQMMYRL